MVAALCRRDSFGHTAVMSSPAAVAGGLTSLDDPIDPAFARELSEGLVAREVPGAVMATLCEENLKAPARVWRDAFEGLLAADPPLASGRISAPTLIVWGARDSLLPREDQEARVAEIPGARFVVYPDVGHLPVVEAPECVAADITTLCEVVAAR